ncbi:hypothetical protein GRI89_06760 [Altererythrobacter salegens]|uniref:Uncharacterized protein n=1 Tax=Croceibacterium salegens TaxID=1737568 RepID=A0A6I4SUT8_9SPHN|nr:hypothetical protein [Croceibacterium salegens]MXO59238.1 hypothetical protein [Croceibacterium salegens]
MFAKSLAGALALVSLTLPQAAWADDPNDPAMRNKKAREADAAEIRRLNREQQAYVSQRDAGYQAGWDAYRAYPQAQADYDKQMAEWRRAVKLCESGHREYCAR